MTQLRIVLGIFIFILGHFGSVSTQSPNVCKTFGSGVIQTFNNTMFQVKSTCPLILTHFSHAGVDCYISVQRDPTGLMKRVEILVNKIVTIIQDGTLTVEGNSISLPNDNTYQSVYKFGIYTRLTSKVLPFSVTWYSLPGGVTSLWVQLDRPLVDGMTGMCGGLYSSETRAQLLDSNIIRDGLCMTEDSQPVDNKICKDFKSEARECLGRKLYIFDQLCKLNMDINVHAAVKCSFYEEFLHPCNGSNPSRSKLRNITSCGEPPCPGNLKFKDQGAAFPPTCSNPQLQTEFQTSTCLPQDGLVLNDRAEGYHSVKVEDCPCVRGGRTYHSGQRLSSKCQTCECIKGKWICSANSCPTPCVIEGWFVTTFDGKQYSLPGKCTYVAARGLNWTVTIKLSDVTIQELYLDVYQERYTFTLNSVQLRENEIAITDLSQTEHVTVYWQSSMFVTVQTTLGIKMQVQVSPEVQMYLYLAQSVTSAGLCGSKNNNTEDDFTTSSGIVENSAQPFALSWTMEDCTPNNSPVCINTDNEIFAEDKCSQLTNASGVFAQCHDYVPVNTYFDACVQRTCHATLDLPERACVGLGNYAKACASQGISVGDWRAETACSKTCDSNLMFDYAMQACNHTCRSLSGPDPTCDMADEPVEGCGCPSGTHLNTPLRCSPRALCNCNYPGGTIPPGSTVIDGLQCMCEYGNLTCSEACDCPHGQICVHCAQAPVNTAQRTCESLSKTFIDYESCISGCYCPEGQFADHNGNCVTWENCTCEFSGVVYATGQSVESNCKICTCSGGQWNCEGDPCPGVCEVFGNGQYKTFDSKWYRFGGHCQYTLVEAIDGLFSIQAESVPCCDEVLTCSRSITVKLMDEVSLILRDMNVTQKVLPGWSFRAMSLYSVHTVGLYFIISVPEIGLTVIWDKQTRVKIELQGSWNGKVRGLCGDFDGKLMNDLQTSSATVVSSTLEFGNSWKTPVPPCSDVTQELFPCERHSYCAAWAQRRCMILHSDTFKDCHLKVDPDSYYQACIMESCSCDFEGKFLGFCTAVAAYADACSAHNACIKWRTPDLCPIYCDYYNEEGQCSWHYEACPQQIKTCGKNNRFSGKLEGCYPRCPTDMPYYDENRRICSSLDNCTCYLNNTVVEPGAKVTTDSQCCYCIGGEMICDICITTTLPTNNKTTETTKTPTITKSTAVSTNPSTTTNTHVTTLTTPVYTTTPTSPVIMTGPPPGLISTGPQMSDNTPSTETTAIKTTTQHITTTPTITTDKLVTTSTPKITIVNEDTTSVPTETPITTITTTPVITTKYFAFTTSLTTTAETPVTIETSTPEISTKEPTTTTSLTTTKAPVTTSTSLITVTSNTTTSLTTSSTETPVITTTTTPEITTEESASTISLTTTTENPVTTSTPKITTVPTTSMSLTTTSTETPVINTTTTPEITTEESASTTSLTTTTETPVTTSTPKITTIHTTSMSVTSTETSVMTTKTTPEITTEASASTTSLTTTTETPVTTSTPKITTVPTTSMSLITTSTETPVITTTTTPELTTKESAPTTSLTTTTETTSTPKITTVPKTSMSLTTTSTETSVITTTTTPEITTEESASTTSYTTTTETPVTTSTPQITTIHTTSMSLTSTETSVMTTKTTPEITTEASASTTSLTTTTETPVTTSTPKITTVPTPSMSLTTTSTETPVKTTITTPELTTKESAPTTSLTTTTETTSTPKITTVPTTSMSLTTTSAETSVITTTTTPEITTEEYASTTSYTTTTETPVTTSTPKITTVPTTSMSLTTTSAETSVITTTTTPEITTEEYASTTSYTTTTETPVTTSTPKITTVPTTAMSLTTIPLSTTTEPPETTIKSTTFVPECKDLIRNQSWPDGYQWTEDCFNKTCINSVIELRPLICPTPVVPVCPRGMPQLVKDEQGCCDTWQCDCQCDVFGDPHYTSFAGQDYMFLENCTYVLVEERMPHHDLSISVDNYYCEESASCAKGIVLKYRNNTVVLQVVQVSGEIPILETTLNEVTIKPPYQVDGFRFVSTDAEVYVYIEEIRSSIFLSVWNTLQINLAMEHFFNNTQGQCGVCGGASCIRRDGSVESEDCCHKTAYEWIEDDPLKPYCAQAPRHVPCIPEKPTYPPPSCITPLCDLLTHEVFSECSLDFDVETLVRNCKFDYCVAQNNATVCSPLEHLADHCKKMGICVAWRNLTSGICDIPCPEGMIFDECRSTPTDFCSGGLRVPGTVLDSMRSGCFCPDNQLLAESHKKICVSECTNCKGPLGEPMPAGAIWESNCHICTCNNQTLTEECWPKPSAPTPTCGSGSTIISDCCNNQICVEKTCDYNEMIYKVGETWRDPKSPCVTFRCTTEGTEIEKTVCPQQFCPEELRVWDEHHCCYSCNTTCGVRLSRMTVENCTQEVILPTCEGNCASGSLWVRSGKDLQLEHNQFCCRERKYELRQISLVCSGETPIQYTYKHITGCECQLEV